MHSVMHTGSIGVWVSVGRSVINNADECAGDNNYRTWSEPDARDGGRRPQNSMRQSHYRNVSYSY